MIIGSVRLIPVLVSTLGILAAFLSGCGGCSGSMLSGDAAEQREASDDAYTADDLSAVEDLVEDTAELPGEEAADAPEEVQDIPDIPIDTSCFEWPSQFDPGEVQVVTWISEYGGDTSDQPRSIRQTPDGGFVAVGHTDSSGMSGDAFWIIRLDARGEVIWQKALDGPEYELGSSVDMTPDGGFIIAGSVQFQSPIENDFMVAKLTQDGGLEWTRVFGCSHWGIGESPQIVTCSDGGFLFAGTSTPLDPTNLTTWIVKFDAAGGILWEKTYDCGRCARDCVPCVGRDIKQTADGDFVAAGYINEWDLGTDFFVLKIDGTGNLQWRKAYGGTNNDDAKSITQASDCGYVVAGVSEGEEENAMVIKIDGDSRLVHYGSFGGNGHARLKSIARTPDGGFAFGGWTMPAEVDIRAWILKTDSMFNIVWQYLYGQGDVLSLGYAFDGGLVAACAGFSEGIPGPSDVRIIKMDASGYPGEGCPDGFWVPSTAGPVDYSVTEREISVDVTDTSAHFHEPDLALIDTDAEPTRVCGP